MHKIEKLPIEDLELELTTPMELNPFPDSTDPPLPTWILQHLLQPNSLNADKEVTT